MAIHNFVPFVAASSYFFTNVASLENPATDVFTIQGSSSRIIVVQGIKVVLAAVASASPLEYTFAVRRSTLSTGGTKTSNFTTVNLDQSGVASTATAYGWTTSPTALGSLVGNVDMAPTASVAGTPPQNPHDAMSVLSLPFGLPGQLSGVTLRSINDTLNVNLGAVGRTITGGLPMYASVYWVELRA